MSTQVQFRRGNSAAIAAFTGAVGEIIFDTTKNTLVVNDGVTAGGYAMARASGYVANTIIYANNTGVVSTSNSFSFDGSTFTVTGTTNLNGTVNLNGTTLTVYDLDDVSYAVDGFTSSFPLTYNQANVSIGGPFNIMVTINGLVQPAYDQKYDTVWLANIPAASKGYCVDLSGNPTTNNYIKFSDCPPAGSQILIRTVAGAVPAAKKTYPFKPLDIFMGY